MASMKLNSNLRGLASLFWSRLGFVFSVLIFLYVLLMPQLVSAHASLTSAVPSMNAELPESPAKITLIFNERLEDGAFYIKVLDAKMKQVTDNKAKLNVSRTQAELDLPQLAPGTYVVTYHVISADGHPVEGTYLFAVGQSLSAQMPQGLPDNGSLHPQHGLSQELRPIDIATYISRIVYYIMLLLFTGWVLWLRLGRFDRGQARDLLAGWTVQLQRVYLIAFMICMFLHIYAMIGGGGPEAMKALFTSTSAGYLWLSSLLLSLLSFVVLYRRVWLDLIWLALIWLCKSLNGHAAAFAPKTQTVLLDWIHLAAAALWMGGLLLLLVLWRRSKEEAKQFFPRFSSAALAAIVLLILSGVFIVLIYLPDVGYVVETQWGKLLLVKSAVVLLVVITGTFLRVLYRRRGLQGTSLFLRIDAVLALLIAVIVGVFTYLTPVPANEPLNWHVMGEKIHMTAQITPNAPGVNEFTVKVWLPEKLGKPKQVIMKLSNEELPDMAPFEVPLAYSEEPVMEYEESYGMKKHTYKASGAYLPYPGNWKAEIRVMDSNDDETVYEKQLRLY